MVKAFGFQRDSHIIRADGKLPVAAVDQNGELHLGRAPVVGERIESGADGAAGEEDVVHENDVGAIDGERDVAFLELRVRVKVLEIVAVERDVEDAEAEFAVVGGKFGQEAFRDLVAPRTDADQGDGLVGVRGADGFGEGFDAL